MICDVKNMIYKIKRFDDSKPHLINRLDWEIPKLLQNLSHQIDLHMHYVRVYALTLCINQHNSWPMSRMDISVIFLINFVVSLSLFSMRRFFWEYPNSRLLMKPCSERYEIQSHGNNAQKDETNRRKGRSKCETILYDLMFDCIVDDCKMFTGSNSAHMHPFWKFWRSKCWRGVMIIWNITQ